MIVQVNGEPRELSEGSTVGKLLDQLAMAPARRGVAVAVAGEVIPRGRWDEHALAEDDRVEVVAAIGGG